MLARDFRGGEPLLPMVVLHAQRPEDDDKADLILDDVHQIQVDHGARCAVLNPKDARPGEEPEAGPGDDRARAAALLQSLDSMGAWGGSLWPRLPTVAYRRYRFRRLRLVHALSDAVRTVDAEERASDNATDPVQRRRNIVGQLAKQRWRPVRANRRDSLGERLSQAGTAGLLAAVLAVLTAVLPLFEAPIAVSMACGFLLLLAVLYFVPVGRAPLLLWLRRESRWFLTTTFLLPVTGQQSYEAGLLHPLRSWRSITRRAGDVAESLRAGGDAQLQLHVLALLEDLRDGHRRLSWDLRGFKRLRPPVLFLHRADASDGGIALLQAISDVRTVRSELDPLLVIASVATGDLGALDRPRGRGNEPEARPAPYNLGERLERLHEEWERALRARQSPSRSGTVPWALRIPLPPEELAPPGQPVLWCQRASARPTFVRVLWSGWVFVVALGVVGGLLVSYQLTLNATYCDTGPFTADRDAKLLAGPGDAKQCIGLSSGAVSFGDRLADPVGKPGAGGTPWSISQLERRIEESNEAVLKSFPHDYVSIVYAGPLSADPEGGSSPVKGAEELAGVAVAQSAVNRTSPVKLRVLVANGGVDMDKQTSMAHSIARYARRDPSLVGVVGVGRDMKSSSDVARILGDAGLPVVSGTNSAAYLSPDHANWFSLAAPDDWQAQQLGLLVSQLRKPGTTQRAVVLSRNTEGTGDRYTGEQEKYGGRMLKAEGFTTPKDPIRYQLRGGRPELGTPVSGICAPGKVPEVIYFAGRVEDLRPLTTALGEDTDCSGRPITLITGDDLSKAHFTQEGIGPHLTLYHATLADLQGAARGTLFYDEANRYLPGVQGKTRATYTSAYLASGQTALSYDATRALFSAASRTDAPQSRAATWVNLRNVNIDGLATGTVDFTQAPVYGSRTGFGIVLWRVERDPHGTTRSTRLCGRTSGPTTEPTTLTAARCPIDRGE